MKNILLTLFAVCLGGFLNAQKATVTTIRACAKGAENRTARLFLEDAMTKYQRKVDEQTIDSNGCFRLEAEILKTQKAFVKIGLYPTYIYIEPGENYKVIYDSFNFRIDEQINPQKLNSFLSYRFEKPDSNELNQLIWRFETLHDRFLTENYHPVNGIRSDDFQRFKAQIEQIFAFSGHHYFKIYRQYALADMERIFNFKSPEKLFFEQLYQKPIYYENTAFADFVTEYYASYFPQQVKYNPAVFVEQVNRAENLPALLDSLGRDTTLQNEKFREFVFLLGLQKMYNNSYFNPSSVLKIIKKIQATTKFREHAELANAILQTLQKFHPGIHQADFRFWDFDKQKKSNLSESPKYKYVLFVNGLCKSCDAEVRSLQTLAEKFSDSVVFWVVNCDYERNRALFNKPQTMQNLTYLHFDKDFETLESLGIIDFPIAVWLDPENKIQSYLFQLPSQQAENSIRKILQMPK